MSSQLSFKSSKLAKSCTSVLTETQKQENAFKLEMRQIREQKIRMYGLVHEISQVTKYGDKFDCYEHMTSPNRNVLVGHETLETKEKMNLSALSFKNYNARYGALNPDFVFSKEDALYCVYSEAPQDLREKIDSDMSRVLKMAHNIKHPEKEFGSVIKTGGTAQLQLLMCLSCGNYCELANGYKFPSKHVAKRACCDCDASTRYYNQYVRDASELFMIACQNSFDQQNTEVIKLNRNITMYNLWISKDIDVCPYAKINDYVLLDYDSETTVVSDDDEPTIIEPKSRLYSWDIKLDRGLKTVTNRIFVRGINVETLVRPLYQSDIDENPSDLIGCYYDEDEDDEEFTAYGPYDWITREFGGGSCCYGDVCCCCEIKKMDECIEIVNRLKEIAVLKRESNP